MNTSTIKALAKEVAAKPRAKKEVSLVQETTILADGSTLQPLPVKNSSDVLRASLLMLFKHVSDIHVSVVEIISDKFNIPIEDLHKAITEDPRWNEMFVHPLITDLTRTVDEHAVPAKKTETKKKAIVISDEPELVFD
jgi:hypothetical protein